MAGLASPGPGADRAPSPTSAPLRFPSLGRLADHLNRRSALSLHRIQHLARHHKVTTPARVRHHGRKLHTRTIDQTTSPLHTKPEPSAQCPVPDAEKQSRDLGSTGERPGMPKPYFKVGAARPVPDLPLKGGLIFDQPY